MSSRPILASLLPHRGRLHGGAACLTALVVALTDLHAQPASSSPAQAAAPAAPIVIRARELSGRTGQTTTAEGEVELTQGPVQIRADRLSYDHRDGVAKASGHVEIRRDGNVFSGPEVQLQVERYEGFFLHPAYHFAVTGAGGQAARLDFLGRHRVAAIDASYSSCTPDDTGQYAWVLEASGVKLDFEHNEGLATGAVLRFYGVPILGAPVLSFPVSDARKSGWLPPSLNLDSRSGLELAVPYYWNIAPQLDMTLTPGIATRRGAFLGSELRYLTPAHAGELQFNLMPEDRSFGEARHLLHLQHRGALPLQGRYRWTHTRASDDDYWKDFERNIPGLTPRLLASDAQADWGGAGQWQAYARIQRWQVLQDLEAPIESPYARMPQLGMRRSWGLAFGPRLDLELEYNRFELPDEPISTRPEGQRTHALARIDWPWIETAGVFVIPRLSLNAAAYRLEEPSLVGGRQRASRLIPSVSLDSGLRFERESRWFGRDYLQTLEPRLLLVHTPYRRQEDLPNFDSAAKDLNFTTLFDSNPFSGVDRVADVRAATAGVTSRFIVPSTGAEALRLGVAQRFLFAEQRITPEGVPFTQRSSDLLLLGDSSLIPNWQLGGSVQYNPEIKRTVRSNLSVRYHPGPFRTVGARYSLVRGATEQLDIGWQWPIYTGARGHAQAGCVGRWYGVGRLNYSLAESRLTDSLLGLEYDSGCWIGRIVAERRSTGQQEAVTRLMLQLEFVGLSRLGSNPLKTLRDNIPGYQLLRDE
ncbi:LPS assembly protein LptD [Caldimonas sp.]|uniref:LPS-assembly protein LptD n=1 Tax=Caldimonas sp. TaxID=2838790 RepID=UPI00307DBFCC